jgi:8-oxo-dGTP pyrophosphatase MutT (NUDIX family)
MTDRPALAEPAPAATARKASSALRPADAATLILVDLADGVPKVLLGRRHPSHRFMPDKYVFPGGRVERGDRFGETASALRPEIEARLMRRVSDPSPAKARALAHAAIRECFEETGLLVGRLAAGTRAELPSSVWSHQLSADLGALHFIARAITPPGRARRFDTRFFAADARAIGHRAEGIVRPDAELVELKWLPVEEAKQLDMPTVTRVVLQELAARAATGFDPAAPVPFYRLYRRRFYRELL